MILTDRVLCVEIPLVVAQVIDIGAEGEVDRHVREGDARSFSERYGEVAEAAALPGDFLRPEALAERRGDGLRTDARTAEGAGGADFFLVGCLEEEGAGGGEVWDRVCLAGESGGGVSLGAFLGGGPIFTSAENSEPPVQILLEVSKAK